MIFLWKRQIEKDLSLLVEVALISPEQGENIRAFYGTQSRGFSTLFVLPLLGVLLIGFGLISLCASNWQHLGDVPKIVVAFLPLVLLSLVLYRKRESTSEVLVQCLTFGVGFAELFALGVVTNLFQTPVSTHLLMQLSLLCLVPLVYVFNAYWLGTLLYAWAISACQPDTLLLSTLSLVVFLPYCYSRICEERNLRCLTILHVVGLFRLLFLYYEDNFSIFFGLAILLIGSGYYRETSFLHLVRNMFSVTGLTLAFFRETMILEVEPLPLLLGLCCVGFAAYQAWHFFDDQEDTLTHGVGITLLSLLLVNAFDIPTSFIATVVMLAVLGLQVYQAFTLRDLPGYNKYSFLFALFVLAKMSSLSMTFFATGVLFIVIGIAFLLLSKVVSDIVKRGD